MIHLYIKTHNKTGLKYFGKTTSNNPYKYKGSGKYWLQHIKKHGNDVTTKIIGSFLDTISCKHFALEFSKKYNIVNSVEWANLINENGIDGAPCGHEGHKFTDTEKQKMSESAKNKWNSIEYRNKLKQIHKDRWNNNIELKLKYSEMAKNRWTEEKRKNHSEKIKGKPGSKKLKGIPKTAEHNKKNSEALKGRKKTKEHIEKLKKPKTKICRIYDKKIMSVNHFVRWLKRQLIN